MKIIHSGTRKSVMINEGWTPHSNHRGTIYLVFVIERTLTQHSELPFVAL